jgi:hypothetical protein
MATLLIKTDGFDGRVLKLKLGTNQLGRGPDNDFRIEHPTISTVHCEIEVVGDSLIVRDCDSTNGTFINGEPVIAGKLAAGDSLRLGQVELVAESTEVTIRIPRFHIEPQAAPPVVLADGSLICPRHPGVRSTYRCGRCREIMCHSCVRRLGRRGGRVYKLCPKCSNHCEIIGGEKKKKKSLLELLKRTIAVPLSRKPNETETYAGN